MSNDPPPTMRALRQTVYAEPPTVETVPTPQPFPGAAIVKIELAPIISYMKNIYNGVRQYPYPTPLTLGTSALGRIAALPIDSTSLQVGQLVLADNLIRSRDKPSDVFLSAIYDGNTEGAKKLMRDVWRDGCYAEYAAVPLESCFVMDEARLLGKVEDGGLGYEKVDLTQLFNMCVPYGGMRDVNVRVGETVIVAPATGGFGGAAVKVALGMGAGKVVIMGRDEKKLQAIVENGGGRVVSVRMTGNLEEELKGLKAACGQRGEADVFFDISPPQASKSTHLKAGICSLRHGGRVSFMGGQGEDVLIPYRRVMHWNLQLHGKWMYERSDVNELIQMAETGALKLKANNKGIFGLGDWEKAADLAEAEVGTGTVFLEP